MCGEGAGTKILKFKRDKLILFLVFDRNSNFITDRDIGAKIISLDNPVLSVRSKVFHKNIIKWNMCWSSFNRAVILEVTPLSCPPYPIFKIVL